MFIRSPYNYDTVAASNETGLECKDESLTAQDQAEDINDIMRKFGQTGKMPSTMRIPLSGDFTSISSYQDALQAVKDAEIEFMKLPARLRERFGHNPQKLIEFTQDEKNAEEGEKLGLWQLKKQASGEATGSAGAESVAKKENSEKTKS